ncbi:MAG: hypothetical protein QOI61_1417 [Actinomycetota bacterium]
MAVLTPGGLGTTGSMQALTCPTSGLATACGAADLVIATVCSNPYPPVGTIGPVTIHIEGGAPVACPEI